MSRDNPTYVRFGHARKSLRSFNYQKARPEAGLSCYRGSMWDENTFMLDTGELSEVPGLTGLLFAAAADRPAYFVAGEEVDRGNDGEPLLAVEDLWRVPNSIALTSTDTTAQPALKFWSEGPRDDTGGKSGKLLAWRLTKGGCSPHFEFPANMLPKPGKFRSAGKHSKDAKKRQRLARKLNRKKAKK